METFEISAQRREELGKGANRRLRRAGYVPAIMYGAGSEPVSLTIAHNDLLKQLEHEAFYSRILTVNIDNQPEKAVLKDLQRHPSRPTIMHLDLQRVSDTQKLHMRVPLHFQNVDKCVGVKQSGGVVSHHLAEVEIRCFPNDLPEFIGVDLQNVELNGIIHLSDLTIPEGIELVGLAHGDSPVVSVHLVRGTQAEDEEEGAVVEEGTEEQPEEDTTKK